MSIRSGPGGDQPDPGLSAIMTERRQLIDIAYRLLGSLAEAEDVVQEVARAVTHLVPSDQRKR